MKKLAIIFVFLISTMASFSQSLEAVVILKINELRAKNGGPDKGLSAFVRNAALDSAAMYHAKWVVASGISSHIETKSVSSIKAIPEFWDRAAKYGATAYCENLIQYINYVKVGIPVEVNKTAINVVTCWKNSPGHLDNMLFTMPKMVEARIGIAIVQYDETEFCVVMVVGANVDRNGNLIK
jgi:uncharacterized protein YkwD